MKIYIAICYDRHVDDEYQAFTDLEDAKAACVEFMDEYSRYGKWVENADFTYTDEWLYYLVFVEWEDIDVPHAYVRSVELRGFDEQK